MSKAGTGHREGCSVPAFSAIIKRKIIDTYRDKVRFSIILKDVKLRGHLWCVRRYGTYNIHLSNNRL